jgi:hypothetical protein
MAPEVVNIIFCINFKLVKLHWNLNHQKLYSYSNMLAVFGTFYSIKN